MPLDIPDSPMPRVVIVGGGFAGLNVANKLKNKKVQLVLLDRNNHHTFQPLLYQVATAGLEAGSIAYPLRKALSGAKNAHFRMIEVDEVLPSEKKIKTIAGYLKYDYLVIATGSKTNFFNMHDIETNAAQLKSVSNAIDMRHLFLQTFEKMLLTDDETVRTRLMNFVIAGGGPTGVELAGALSELRKMVLPKDYPELDLTRMRIILIDPGNRLLSAMSESASDHALKYLLDLGIEVKFGSRVMTFDGKLVTLNGGETIETETMIWAAGVQGGMIDGFDSTLIARGNRVIVDEYNRIKGFENIFALGDVSMQQDDRYANGLPGLAPVAIQQGQYVAGAILRIINNQKPKPFKYWDKGSLATIGRLKAVGDLPKNLHLHGMIAWMAWLFVHLFYLIGFGNKAMVFFDWVWNYTTYDRRVRLIVRPFRRS
jgi:NADH dehydrogenase